MADSTPAAAAAPQKPIKKRSSKGKKSTGTPVSQLILKAVSESKDRKGISYQAIKRYLKSQGYDVVRNRARCRLGLKALLKRGELRQVRGTGCSGSYKLAKKQQEKRIRKKKPSKKASPTKKPRAKKVSKAKKPSSGKKPKKPVKKKPAKAKSQKKDKVAAKKTSVKKTKVIKKSPKKKPAAKKPSPKKSPGRKK